MLLYLFSVVFGFAILNNSGHDHVGHNPCPFMMGEPVFCDMNLFEHMSLWQKTFIGIVDKALSVNLFSIYMLFLTILAPIIYSYIFYYFKTTVNQFDFYSILFSDGLLNPKAP